MNPIALVPAGGGAGLSPFFLFKILENVAFTLDIWEGAVGKGLLGMERRVSLNLQYRDFYINFSRRSHDPSPVNSTVLLPVNSTVLFHDQSKL